MAKDKSRLETFFTPDFEDANSSISFSVKPGKQKLQNTKELSTPICYFVEL